MHSKQNFFIAFLLAVLTLASLTTKAQSGIINGKIAFSSSIDGDFEIYTINSDGTSRQQLTNNNYDDRFPDWSLDGSSIVFVSNRENNQPRIFTMNHDGSNQLKIIERYGVSPDWSPDGTKIAFRSNRDDQGFPDIFIMNADGTNVVNITNSANYSEGSPDWSLDGNKIVYTQVIPDSNASADTPVGGDLYTMLSNGSNKLFLTKGGIQVHNPSWSPDNTKVVFGFTTLTNVIGIVNADGTNLSTIGMPDEPESINNPRWKFPAWSPDGTKLVAISGSTKIQILDPDGTNIITILNENALIEEVAWQPVLSSVATNTPSLTFTPSNTYTSTNTPTFTPTWTSTLIPTTTPTWTPTATPSYTPTWTPSTNGPTVSINDINVTEGTGGTNNLVFTVSLSAQTSSVVTVDYTLAGTAASTKDYGAVSPASPLIIPANTLTRTITVPIVTDNYAEPAETVGITLTGATNAVLATGGSEIGVGTINNDDLIVGDFSTSGNGTECTEVNFNAAFALGGTITFSCPNPTTITFTQKKTISPANITINGGNTITLDGGDTTLLFHLTNGARTLTLQNITLANGYGNATSGAIINAGGTLNITNVIFTDNQSDGANGGAVSNNGGIVNITNSSFINNAAIGNGYTGGAIVSSGTNPIINIIGSTFSGNTANGGTSNRGGAIQITAGRGNIANSTFINNSTSGQGGAVRAFAGTGVTTTVNITNSTFSGNAATGGGSVMTRSGTGTTSITVRNSILTNSTTATHCNATITDGTGNVIHGSTCNGITGASTSDPLLGASIGNPAYLPLQTSSSAIDLVSNCTYLSTTDNPLFTDGATVTIDQRGVSRPFGSACDAGAYEKN